MCVLVGSDFRDYSIHPSEFFTKLRYGGEDTRVKLSRETFHVPGYKRNMSWVHVRWSGGDICVSL